MLLKAVFEELAGVGTGVAGHVGRGAGDYDFIAIRLQQTGSSEVTGNAALNVAKEWYLTRYMFA